jgi:hypothetical protein
MILLSEGVFSFLSYLVIVGYFVVNSYITVKIVGSTIEKAKNRRASATLHAGK